MKKFRHTRRSAILFLLLTPLTLCIYPIVVLCHVGKEVNRINEGKQGYVKSMNFVGAFFLGFITLGIVPLVWTCKVASKIGTAAKENGIAKPSVRGLSMFLLTFLFSWLIVTFIVGWCKFFHTLNALERKLNADMIAMETKAAQEEILPVESAPAAEEAASEEEAPATEEGADSAVMASTDVEEPVVTETPSQEEAVEPVEEAKAEDERPSFEFVTEKENPIPGPNEPRSDIAAIYHVAGRKETRKWQVRLSDEDQPVKLFDSQEEALAYAKGLATRKRATVRVKPKQD